MIRLYHVQKSYVPRQFVLRDVNLHVAPGEFLFLMGPSGAGKTTLLKLLIRAEIASAGQIIVNGRNISRLRATDTPLLRRDIGFIFQDFKLIPYRTVFENVAIALEVVGWDRRSIHKQVSAVLRQLGLEGKERAYPPVLSGGEQQRVAIARALVGDPPIILADEPTGNLDDYHAEETLRTLQRANQRGTTVLVATHDVNLSHRAGVPALVLMEGGIEERVTTFA